MPHIWWELLCSRSPSLSVYCAILFLPPLTCVNQPQLCDAAEDDGYHQSEDELFDDWRRREGNAMVGKRHCRSMGRKPSSTPNAH
jgi:hypothetical protein